MELNENTVNRFVAEGILKSALGQKFKESIDRIMADFDKKDGRTATCIDEFVRDQVRIAVADAFHASGCKEKIRAVVAEKITDQFLKTWCDKAWDALESRWHY